MARPALPDDQLSGRGVEAARWLRESGGTFSAAGRKFGCTAQAVAYSWRRLDLGEAPNVERMNRHRVKALELAAAGMPAGMIAIELGVSQGIVRIWCARAGVEIARVPVGPMPAPGAEIGFEAIRQGKQIAEAAKLAGMTYTAFAKRMRRAGLAPRQKGGRTTGLSAVASALVDSEGITVNAAAARVGVSPGVVRLWRSSRGLAV